VSYLHSGVLDTAVQVTAMSQRCAAESDFLTKKRGIIREDIRKKVGGTNAQRRQ
jgi:hypothetical protein